MTVSSITKDLDALTMTVVADFPAPAERVWQIWSDPRQLERWWGPPTYPATVMEHDLTPGGAVNYLMTGPEGDTYRGWWRVIAVQAPHLLEFEDGFADETGAPNLDLPTTTARMTLETTVGGTRMQIVTTFPSLTALEELAAMGMEEGLRAALGQVDALLTGANA